METKKHRDKTGIATNMEKKGLEWTSDIGFEHGRHERRSNRRGRVQGDMRGHSSRKKKKYVGDPYMVSFRSEKPKRKGDRDGE